MIDFGSNDEGAYAARLAPPAGRPGLVGLLYWPDVLELREAGYELERFNDLLVAMDAALLSQALAVSQMLRQNEANPIWNPMRAAQYELRMRDLLHEFGMAQVPGLLRRMLGRVFEGDSKSYLTVDLLNVFYFACLALIARDYAWRMPALAVYAEYVSFPVRSVFDVGALFDDVADPDAEAAA